VPLSVSEEAAAVQARLKGRESKLGAHGRGNRMSMVTNEFPQGTFHAYCWSAGYNHDARNVHELHRDWEASEKSKS
jgi:hypothetical protein